MVTGEPIAKINDNLIEKSEARACRAGNFQAPC
jgi:hypothetical protein